MRINQLVRRYEQIESNFSGKYCRQRKLGKNTTQKNPAGKESPFASIFCWLEKSVAKRMWLNILYHFKLKGRVHIGKYLHKPYLPIGIRVSNTEAMEIKAIEDVQWQKG